MSQRIFVASIGDYVEFPDDWSDEDISRWVREGPAPKPETDLIGAARHGAEMIIPKARSGFANQAAAVYNMLPMPDFAEEKPRKFIKRQQELAADASSKAEEKFTPDTLSEKIVAGVASSAGDIAPLLPHMVAAAPLAPAAGGGYAASALASALGLSVPSFLEKYGESGDIEEGVKAGGVGAAEGALFGVFGKASGLLKNPLARRAAHATGGGVVGGGSALAQGADPEDAAAAAATLFALSGAASGGKKRVKNKVKQSLEDIELEKAKDNIVTSAPGMMENIPGGAESRLWLKEKFLDVGARIDDTVNKILAENGAELRPSRDPRLLRKRNTTAAASQARAGAEQGFIDTLDPSAAPRTKSLYEIHESARPTDGAERAGKEWVMDYEAYLDANRVKEVREQGVDFKGFSDNPDMVISAIERKYSPETINKWKGAQKDFNNIGNFLVDMLQRSGVLTKESATAIKKSDKWVSLQRYLEPEPGDAGAGGGGATAMHRMRGGSGQKVTDLYYNTISLAERSYKQANHNYYMNSLMDVLGSAKNPEVYAQPVRSVEFISGIPKKVTSKTRMKTLDSVDKSTKIKEVTKVPVAEFKKQAVAKARERFNDKDNIVTFYRDGKPVSYKLDPTLYNAIRKSGRANLPVPRALELILTGPKKIATLGYTGLNVGFSFVTNPIRDLFSAILQSSDAGKTGMSHLSRLWETTAGRAMERGEGPLTESHKRYLGSGAKIAGPVEADIGIGLSVRDKIINNSEHFRIPRNLIRHPIDTLRDLTSWSEDINRVPEYRLMEKKYGAGTADANIAGMAASKDVTLDFSRMGEYTRWANEVIPFFNAAFQGADKFRRTLKERPVAATLQATAQVTLPMLGLWAINKDEEWYQEIPMWEKTLFAHIRPFDDGPIFRLPLPFEWGILFGSVPVSLADSAYQKDPQRLKDGVDQALKTLLPDFVPQVGKPLIEAFANRDMFRDRDLESAAMERRLPSERFRETTPLLYRGVGQATGLSPAKIQHVAESYTGGLIKEPVNAIDIIMGKQDAGGSNIPLLNRLLSSQDRQGESVSRFHENYKLMQQAWTSAKKRHESGDILGARNVLQDHADLLGLTPGQIAVLTRRRKWSIPDKLKKYNKVADKMSKVRKRKGENSEITALARLALGRN